MHTIPDSIAILAAIALYGAGIVAPWHAKLERVCGASAAQGSPAYARCTLALQAGQSDNAARAAMGVK